MITRRILVIILLLWIIGSAFGAGAQGLDNVPFESYVDFGALQLQDGVRHTVTFAKPYAFFMDNVYAEIALPADARVVGTQETAQMNYRGLLAQDGVQWMRWTADRIDAEDGLSAFTFTTERALSAPLRFTLQWQTEGVPFAITAQGNPQIYNALANSGAFTPGPSGTEAAYVSVGDTGVRVNVPAGISGTFDIARLPTDNNPPPEFGAYWWCSVLRLDGVTAPIDVQVPLRRPLTPFTEVALFAQGSDGRWSPLPVSGIVLPDGQHVSYPHPGGVIASGVGLDLQPISVPESLVQQLEPLPIDIAQIAAVIPTETPLPTEAPPAEPTEVPIPVVTPAGGDGSVRPIPIPTLPPEAPPAEPTEVPIPVVTPAGGDGSVRPIPIPTLPPETPPTFVPTLTLELLPQNQPPAFSQFNQTVTLDITAPPGTLVGSVTAIDPEGLPVSYSASNLFGRFSLDTVTGEIRTTVDLVQAGTLGDDVFTLFITAADAGSPPASATATFTIIILASEAVPLLPPADQPTPTPFNQPPVPQPPFEFTVPAGAQNGTVIGQLQAADPDGDPVTFGTAIPLVGFSITPDGLIILQNRAELPRSFDDGSSNTLLIGETGPTLPVTLLLVAQDNRGGFTPFNVTIFFEPPSPNRPPVPQPPFEFTVPAGTQDGTVIGQLQATDPDGDPVTFFLAAPAIAFDIASNGVITFRNLARSQPGFDDGTSNTIFIGEREPTQPTTLLITVQDNRGGSTTFTVTIFFEQVAGPTAVPPQPNQPPTPVPDSYTSDEAFINVSAIEGVLRNDTDDGQIASLTAQLVTPPTNGVVTLNADGSFFYASFTADAPANDSFTYSVSDGEFQSGPVSVVLATRQTNGLLPPSPVTQEITPPLTQEVLPPPVTQEVAPPLTQEVLPPPVTQEVAPPLTQEVIPPALTQEAQPPVVTEVVLPPAFTPEVVAPPRVSAVAPAAPLPACLLPGNEQGEDGTTMCRFNQTLARICLSGFNECVFFDLFAASACVDGGFIDGEGRLACIAPPALAHFGRGVTTAALLPNHFTLRTF